MTFYLWFKMIEIYLILPTQYFVTVEQIVQIYAHCCQAKVHFHTASNHNCFVHVFGEVNFCLHVRGYILYNI